MRTALTLLFTATLAACHSQDGMTSPGDEGEILSAASPSRLPEPRREATTGEIEMPCWRKGTRPEGSQFPEYEGTVETGPIDCRIPVDLD